MNQPLHTLVLILGCVTFVLGLFDSRRGPLILGAVIIAVGVFAH